MINNNIHSHICLSNSVLIHFSLKIDHFFVNMTCTSTQEYVAHFYFEIQLLIVIHTYIQFNICNNNYGYNIIKCQMCIHGNKLCQWCYTTVVLCTEITRFFSTSLKVPTCTVRV